MAITWADLADVEWERIGMIGNVRIYECQGLDGILSVEFATTAAAQEKDCSQVVSADFTETDGTNWRIDWPNG